MNNEKYSCPLCGNTMYWTGNISQNMNNKRYCSILYQYRCVGPNCIYESKYEQLDSSAIRRISYMNREYN